MKNFEKLDQAFGIKETPEEKAMMMIIYEFCEVCGGLLDDISSDELKHIANQSEGHLKNVFRHYLDWMYFDELNNRSHV